jgi:hypothetical protein
MWRSEVMLPPCWTAADGLSVRWPALRAFLESAKRLQRRQSELADWPAKAAAAAQYVRVVVDAAGLEGLERRRGSAWIRCAVVAQPRHLAPLRRQACRCPLVAGHVGTCRNVEPFAYRMAQARPRSEDQQRGQHQQGSHGGGRSAQQQHMEERVVRPWHVFPISKD